MQPLVPLDPVKLFCPCQHGTWTLNGNDNDEINLFEIISFVKNIKKFLFFFKFLIGSFSEAVYFTYIMEICHKKSIISITILYPYFIFSLIPGQPENLCLIN